MERREPKVESGVPYHISPLLESLGIPHGFSLRYYHGADGRRRRLNLGFTAERAAGEALKHRRLFCRSALGADIDRLTTGCQMHTGRTALVGADDVGRGGRAREAAFPDTDALATGVAGAVLGVFTADCVPVLLAEPGSGCVAAVHAGWRGTAKRIVCNTVELMVRELGAEPGSMAAAVGPSISAVAYEVGDDVFREFESVFAEGRDRVFIQEASGGKWRLDLWEANRRLLVESGLDPDRIDVLGLCTASDEESFYSNRRDGGVIGSLGAFIGCAFSAAP